MPIGAYLDGADFDPESIRLMGIAFEMALASRAPPSPTPIQFVRGSLGRSSSLQKALGLQIPDRLLALANEVIE